MVKHSMQPDDYSVLRNLLSPFVFKNVHSGMCIRLHVPLTALPWVLTPPSSELFSQALGLNVGTLPSFILQQTELRVF